MPLCSSLSLCRAGVAAVACSLLSFGSFGVASASPPLRDTAALHKAAALTETSAMGAAQSRPSARRTRRQQQEQRRAEQARTQAAQEQRILAAQVGLDRANFSPGEIDGRDGPNLRAAVSGFQASKGLPVTGLVDDGLLAALGRAAAQATVQYVISPADAAGPFIETLPEDMMEKAKLPALGYRSVIELLAERFHASPDLLTRMNPAAAFVGGETITVPNVEPFQLPAESVKRKRAEPAPTELQTAQTGAAAPVAGQSRAPAPKAAAPDAPGAPAPDAPAGTTASPGVTVSVTKESKVLTVKDPGGAVIFQAPVTVGSERDPLPVGEWKVTGVYFNPPFYYNPDLFWDADPSHSKAKIPPGPNNPVGPIWIDLSKEHYGFPGTPEPGSIGHTASHGCVRLTNWDAVRLAALVDEGTQVIFQ